MGLFELLAEFLKPLLDLFPRVAHRPAINEFLVIDRWFGVTSVASNPVVYSPAFTHVEYYPKRFVPIDCSAQKLTTSDNKAVIVNATMVVQIVDPVRVRESVGEDWEEYLSMMVREEVCSVTQKELAKDLPAGYEDCFKYPQLAVDMDRIGVQLCAVRVEDFQVARSVSVTM